MTKPEIINAIYEKIMAYYGKAIFDKTRKERKEICNDAFRRFLSN